MPNDINNAGDVLTSGAVDVGGTSTPVAYPGAGVSEANGLNNTGEIVGDYAASEFVSAHSGFLDNNGTYTTVNYPGATDTFAEAINDTGEIVGNYDDSKGNAYGFTDVAGVFTSIQYPGAVATDLSGVNNAGEIVGTSYNSAGVAQGFTYVGGVFTAISYPGAVSTNLAGINNEGEISGYGTNSSGSIEGFVDDNGVFTPVPGPNAGEGSALGGINDSGQVVGVNGTEPNGFVATPVCFAQSTRILTSRGYVAVESLRVGDVAIAACGSSRPIRWLGHRITECRSPNTMPIRISAGAFGGNLPRRDLYLSPGHPVLVGADEGEDGHLVPIMCLINGTTIDRVKMNQVTYWHVELDEHDILLAEGLPAESYIDLGSRPWFGGAEGTLYDPDTALPGMPGRCRPVVVDGPVVEAERRRLDTVFAESLVAACGWPAEADPGCIT